MVFMLDASSLADRGGIEQRAVWTLGDDEVSRWCCRSLVERGAPLLLLIVDLISLV